LQAETPVVSTFFSRFARRQERKAPDLQETARDVESAGLSTYETATSSPVDAGGSSQ